MTATDVWARLDEPWRLAFAEAWASWRAGNFGVGAVLVDPADGSVVSTGRNRVAETERRLGELSGNMTAHAEMNAFARLDRFNAVSLDLTTTLEPCLMCLGTATLLKVARIRHAADDEFFDGLVDAWQAHPVTATRMPEIERADFADGGRLAAFARLLPMTFTLRMFPGRSAAALARERHPGLARFADDLDPAAPWPADVAEALDLWWERLGETVS